MGNQKRIRTANDNAPTVLSRYAEGCASAESAPVKPLREQPLNSIPDMFQTGKPSVKTDITQSLRLAIGCWITALIMMIVVFSVGMGTGPKIFASLSLLWAGLWSSYVSADHGRWRLSELSVVTALLGLMGSITTSANYFNLGLTLADGLLLMSILPLLIGHILKSRICILASICASLIWGGLSFAGLVETSNLIMLVPAICIAQTSMATKIHSGMAITLAVITTYYWVFHTILTHWSADNLPLTFAAAALFVLGVAHHRGGKAAEDMRITGSSIHIHVGWIAAMIGALGFQYFWLTPDAIENSTATLSVNGLGIWKAIIITALAAIFGGAIIRYKHSEISLFGIFLLTSVSAIIPMMLWFPSWPQNVASSIPGVTAMSTIGVFMGGAIIAAALGMAFNGVRRHSLLMMGMGIVVLLAEAYFLIRPELTTLDNSVIFVIGFLVALTVGGVIAGSSLAHQASAPRLKHT